MKITIKLKAMVWRVWRVRHIVKQVLHPKITWRNECVISADTSPHPLIACHWLTHRILTSLNGSLSKSNQLIWDGIKSHQMTLIILSHSNWNQWIWCKRNSYLHTINNYEIRKRNHKRVHFYVNLTWLVFPTFLTWWNIFSNDSKGVWPNFGALVD